MAFRASARFMFGRSASLVTRGSLPSADKKKLSVGLRNSAAAANLGVATPINGGFAKGSPLALARSALLSRTVPDISTPMTSTTFSTTSCAPQAACLPKILAALLPSGQSSHLGRNATCRYVTSTVQGAGRVSTITPATYANVLSRGHFHGSASVGEYSSAFTRISSRNLRQSYGRSMFTSAGGSGGGYVVGGLIAANLAVLCMWRYLPSKFMSDNFLLSFRNIESGRYHTLLTTAFSQIQFAHLFSNMIGLYFFGSEIAMLYGGTYLLSLYFTGAFVSSMCHLAYYKYVYPQMERQQRRFRFSSFVEDYPALGASGAVNAIVLLNCLLFPTRIVYLNFFIPVPGLLLGLVFIGKDFFGAAQTHVGEGQLVGHAAHLGGAAVGFVAWAVLFFGR